MRNYQKNAPLNLKNDNGFDSEGTKQIYFISFVELLTINKDTRSLKEQ